MDRFPKNPEDCVCRGDFPSVPRMQEISGCLSKLRLGGVTSERPGTVNTEQVDQQQIYFPGYGGDDSTSTVLVVQV